MNLLNNSFIKCNRVPNGKVLFPRLAWNDGVIKTKTIVGGAKARAAIKEVKEKILRREYLFEECLCFCGHNDDIPMSEIDRYGFYYSMVICKVCGLMRANPRMTQEAYIQFYTHEYRDAYGAGDKDIDEVFAERLQQHRLQYDYFMKSIELPNNATIFDIGCDFGTMLVPFMEKGHDVYGCDYGIEHIEYGREKTGIKNIFFGGPEKLSELNKKADFIIISHALEHFLYLEEILELIRSLLKPSGICYIEVPGTYGRIKKWSLLKNNLLQLLQNAHIYQFNLATLQYVVECCGFEFIKGDENVRAFFKYSKQYRDKSDHPLDECRLLIKHLRSAEQKYLIRCKLVTLLRKITRPGI